MPWPLTDEADLVAVDMTWGRLQPREAVPEVRAVGERKLQALVAQGARLVDSRVPGSFGGNLQCPPSPDALKALVTRGIRLRPWPTTGAA